jgi:hypothetical protein
MASEEEVIDRGDFFEGSDEDESEEIEVEELEEDQEEESEEDQEEEPEEDESYEEEEEEIPPPKKEPRIPKSRFDEVNERMKEANERNLWLEEQLETLIKQSAQQQKTAAPKEPEVPEYDYDLAEEKYISLIIEGDITKATKLRNEINTFRQNDLKKLISGIESKAMDGVKSESNQLLEKERFATSISTMESKYPFLNHKDKAYNEEAVETVNTLLAGYIASGKGKVESLQLAIKKVLPLYDKKSTKQTLGEQRKSEAGKKAAAASKQQPAKGKTTARTSDTGKVDINRMSERDFKKLTAKEKSILRGD